MRFFTKTKRVHKDTAEPEQEDEKFSSKSNYSNSKQYQNAEIKKLYRHLVKKYHPDFARSDEDKKFRTELTAKINNAYERGDIATLKMFE